MKVKRRKIRFDRLFLVIGCMVFIFASFVFVAYKGIEFFVDKTYAQELPTEDISKYIIAEIDNTALASIENEEVEEREEKNEKRIYLGEFLLTGYCPCEKCSEGWDRKTATGTTAEEGRTVAVDPNVIPYGSILEIDGHRYIAEDCGGMINDNHIDIFKNLHEDCFGDDCNGYHSVYLIKE